MRKFKHKINGSIAELIFIKSLTKNNFYSIKHKEGFTHIPLEFIENSNDWEEVKEEPNYLITGFIDSSRNIYKIDRFGNFKYGFNILSLNQLIADYQIYSVKNNKGEEFTIGDNVFYLPKRSIELFKIHNFFINRDGILLARSSEESSATCEDINTISKEIKVPYMPKQPIYTTTDGKEIFEGDNIKLYLFSKVEFKEPLHTYKINVSRFSEKDVLVANRYHTFISEENRDKYIKENTPKPFFKTEDGVDIYEGAVIYIVSLEEQLIFPETFYFNKTMTGNAIFFDEKMALKYLNENTKKKPIFTSADGKEIFEEDTIYIIIASFNDNSLIIVEQEYNRWENMFTENKQYNNVFSTNELAQEYIDNNKPKYSLADIEKAYCKAMNSEFDGLGEIIEELKKLGK